MLKKICLITLVFSLVIVPMMGISVSAAETTKTINLAYVKQHEYGNGYAWDNINKVLTLNGLNVNTDDDWGLRLPDNATVMLVGTNTIKAGKWALGCPGNVTIKGDGKLILESGEHAIYVHSRTDSHKFRIFDGEIEAKGGVSAFYSEVAEFSMTDGKVNFSSNGDYAVMSRVFAMTGGKATVNGTLKTTHLLRLNHADLVVNDDEKALEIGNLFEHDNVKFMAGNTESSLSDIDSYNDEKTFKTIPLKLALRDSIIFGEGTTIIVDYVLLGAAIILLVAAITIPVVLKKRKTKKMYMALDAAKKK